MLYSRWILLLHGLDFFFCKDCGMYCMSVLCLFYCAESLPFCNSHYLFTLLFLSKQTRHGRKIISYLYFLFISGCAKCLSCKNVQGHECKSSCLVVQVESADYLEWWWQLWVKLVDQGVLMVMKRPTSEIWTQYSSRVTALFTIYA